MRRIYLLAVLNMEVRQKHARTVVIYFYVCVYMSVSFIVFYFYCVFHVCFIAFFI